MVEISWGGISGILSLLALWVAWQSYRASEQALSLSLFNKRYSMYHEVKKIVSRLEADDTKYMSEVIPRLKLMSWEAEYIFGNDVCDLLRRIINHCAGTQMYYQLGNDMANGSRPENYELIGKYNQEHRISLQALLAELVNEDGPTNLCFYFDSYLKDDAFRLPLKGRRNFSKKLSISQKKNK